MAGCSSAPPWGFGTAAPPGTQTTEVRPRQRWWLYFTPGGVGGGEGGILPVHVRPEQRWKTVHWRGFSESSGWVCQWRLSDLINTRLTHSLPGMLRIMLFFYSFVFLFSWLESFLIVMSPAVSCVFIYNMVEGLWQRHLPTVRRTDVHWHVVCWILMFKKRHWGVEAASCDANKKGEPRFFFCWQQCTEVELKYYWLNNLSVACAEVEAYGQVCMVA